MINVESKAQHSVISKIIVLFDIFFKSRGHNMISLHISNATTNVIFRNEKKK